MTPICALCAAAPASVFCVNDDASLCAPCDARFHANPLSARHERRPLAAAPSPVRVPSSSFDDVAVVPQCGPSPTLACAPTSTIFDDIFNAAPSFIEDAPGPDGFAASDFVTGPDGLMCFNFDSAPCGDVEVPDFFEAAPVPSGGVVNPFMHPLTDAAGDDAHPMLVPQLIKDEEEEAAPASPASYFDDEELAESEDDDEEFVVSTFRRAGRRATAGQLTRSRRGPQDVAAAAAAALAESEVELTREQRVARYKEKRARRNFRKTIRYQSRKAYAEIRPRIKGRFVSPEEYAAYMAGNQDAVVPSF